jgi:hypothetical protein
MMPVAASVEFENNTNVPMLTTRSNSSRFPWAAHGPNTLMIARKEEIHMP